MKSLSVLLLLFAFGCSTQTTMVTGSWKNPNDKKSYNKILVAALVSNTIAKATLESNIVTELGKKGVFAEKSIDRFPPDLSHSDTDKTALMDKVKLNETNAILTVSILDKETESRFVPGSYSYDPYAGPAYYRSFWGYYSHMYPYVYRPGYYVTENTYFIETNLYDVATEDLIWSAQSETYDPANLARFARDYADVIVAEMQKDGILGGQGLSGK